MGLRDLREAPRASGERFASVQLLNIICGVQSSTENCTCARRAGAAGVVVPWRDGLALPAGALGRDVGHPGANRGAVGGMGGMRSV